MQQVVLREGKLGVRETEISLGMGQHHEEKVSIYHRLC